jgi:hypothetical protein
MYSELISPIMAKHEMAKNTHFCKSDFFCHLKWDFFVKKKGQTMLEGIQMAKKSISDSKNKISFANGYFFAI